MSLFKKLTDKIAVEKAKTTQITNESVELIEKELIFGDSLDIILSLEEQAIQLNEANLFSWIKWKLALFSLRFLKEENINQILQAYYAEKDGKLGAKSKSVLTMSKKEKISILRNLAEKIPDKAKEKILSTKSADVLSKKAKAAGVGAVGAATISGVGAAATGAQASSALQSSQASARSAEIVRGAVTRAPQEIENIQNTINNNNAEIEKNKEELESLNNSKLEAEAKLKELELSYQKELSEYNSAKENRDSIKQNLDRINGQINGLTERISSNNSRINELNSTITNLTNENVQLIARNAAIIASAGAKLAEIGVINGRIEWRKLLGQPYDDLVAQRTALLNEISDLEKEFALNDNKINANNNTISQNTSQINNLTDQNTQDESKINELQEERGEVLSELSDAENTLTEEKNDLDEISETRDSAQDELDNLESDINDSEREISNLENNNEKLEDDINAHQENLETGSERAEELENQSANQAGTAAMFANLSSVMGTVLIVSLVSILTGGALIAFKKISKSVKVSKEEILSYLKSRKKSEIQENQKFSIKEFLLNEFKLEILNERPTILESYIFQEKNENIQNSKIKKVEVNNNKLQIGKKLEKPNKEKIKKIIEDIKVSEKASQIAGRVLKYSLNKSKDDKNLENIVSKIGTDGERIIQEILTMKEKSGNEQKASLKIKELTDLIKKVI
jgi:golgin subfamily B member 1